MRIKTTGTNRRYFIHDLAPKPEDEWVQDRLTEHRFRSIDQSSQEMESFGWVTLRSPSATQFPEEEIWWQDILGLGIRVDRKKVPSQALNVRLLERVDAEEKVLGGPVPRARRKELKDEVESELMQKILPTTNLHQVLWHVPSGLILFNSAGAPANRALMSLFVKTFGKAPISAGPGVLAEHAELPESHRRRLIRVSAMSLVGGNAGGRLS